MKSEPTDEKSDAIFRTGAICVACADCGRCRRSEHCKGVRYHFRRKEARGSKLPRFPAGLAFHRDLTVLWGSELQQSDHTQYHSQRSQIPSADRLFCDATPPSTFASCLLPNRFRRLCRPRRQIACRGKAQVQCQQTASPYLSDGDPNRRSPQNRSAPFRRSPELDERTPAPRSL
jgi:hypothetical protein